MGLKAPGSPYGRAVVVELGFFKLEFDVSIGPEEPVTRMDFGRRDGILRKFVGDRFLKQEPNALEFLGRDGHDL